MKRFFTFATLSASLCSYSVSSANEPIILDETGIANLRIETVKAEPHDFAETIFAVGRIEPVPARKSILSSRVPGQVVTVNAYEGDKVEQGQTLVEIESLQPGNPPPRIPLQAPLPGLVMQSHTHLGKPVTPDSELFEIIDLSEVYAVARLPEDQAGRTHLGTRANIKVAAAQQTSFTGELIRYGSEANAASGTLDAFFRLENPEYLLRPNMRAEFSIILDTRSNTMAVPKDSVHSDGINSFVFVSDYDLPNAFVKVPVITGTRNETHVEILKGLFPGDEVVTTGSYSLMFAGSGTISLKEALDAAHGHEHNEDGSEMTPEQRRAKQLARNSGASAGSSKGIVVFLSILSGILFVLLLLSLLARKGKAES